MLEKGRVGVIGDLIASKASSNRYDLQSALVAALDITNRLAEALDPLTITVGDEFQGLYNSVDEAVAATLVVQLKLGHDRVRFGIGSGSLAVYQQTRTPYAQDGPVWWAARTAIEQVGRSNARRRTALVSSVRGPGRSRTRQATDQSKRVGSKISWEQLQLPGLTGGLPPQSETVYFDVNALVNSLLGARDALLATFDERDNAIAIGLLENKTQAEIGDQLGVSQSAVSQRIKRSGLDLLSEGFHLLKGDQS